MCLGTMAVALVLSTMMQMALMYTVVRSVRAVQARLLIVEKQFTPLLGHVTVIAGRLEHSTRIAAAQLDRLDAALTDASRGLSSARGVMRMAAGSVSGASMVTTALTGLMAWRRRRAARAASAPSEI